MNFDNIQQYGKIGIFTHLALSWSFLFGTYFVVNKTGKPEKIIKYLKLQNKIPAKAGAFAISGIIYKAVMPLRIGLTLLVLPLMINLQQT